MISELRAVAKQAFFDLLKLKKHTKISEKEFSKQWLSRIYSYGSSFDGGWYVPPPQGCAVLFGHGGDGRRVSFDTLRSNEYWPSDIELDWDDGIVYGYVSPVGVSDGMMGDFSAFHYFGENTNISNHILHCREVNNLIISSVECDMTSAELFGLAMKIVEKNDLFIYGYSKTDCAGINLGHSFVRLAPLKEHSPNKLSDRQVEYLSNSRKFINQFDNWALSEAPCFTIEPRLLRKGRPDLPLVSLHTLARINNGNLSIQH